MLDKKRIEEVLMRSFGLPPSQATADILSTQMGLPVGSIVFGEDAIEISDGSEKLNVQYTPEGRIAFV